jgi:ABC-2 type transport system ATP-binding protein
VIEVDGLGKHFGPLEAVRDLSFRVTDGEIFGLLGPNGAGKTTTVRMLAGLIAPSAGSATINGHRIGHESHQIRALTGILTESPGLHDRLTARENLAYYGRLYGLSGGALRRAVDRYLGVVGLDGAGERRVAGFSKGMRQKVAIARALLHDPQVIYLDEPTSGLDPSAAKTVRDFVATLRDAGRSIIICTHNLDEAERLSDRIGIIRRELLLVDTPANLRRNGGRTTTRIELAAPAGPYRHALGGVPVALSVSAEDGVLSIEVADPHRDNPALVAALAAAGAPIVAVHEESASLEDVYLRLVGEAAEHDDRPRPGNPRSSVAP